MTGGDESSGAFLQLTDLHFWRIVFNPLHLTNKRFLGNLNVVMRRRHEMMIDQAADFIEHIARVGVRDVLLTGDLTSSATDAEYRAARGFVEALSAAGLRPVVIPGNHDVYTFESERNRRFERYLGEWTPGTRLPVRGTLSGGTPIVFVPTVCANLISSRGRVTRPEVDAVRACLDGQTEPLIVAAHYPILDKTYGYAMSPHRRLRGAVDLRAALASYAGRLLYIAGHVHRFSHVIDPTYPFINYLTTGSLFRRDHDGGHTGEFSEVRIGQGGFRVLRHRYAGEWSVTEQPPRTADVADCPSV